LNENLEKSLSHKRAGTAVPTFLEQDIQQANKEIARADEEITAAKSNIKKSQQTFSK
jgi:ppGpp synthetase/RelA/SpoT-type nucleotidyltranferase